MRKVTIYHETLRLRFTVETKRILKSAAAATHQSLSEFVLDSARRRAEEILPNRQRFCLSAKNWEAFQRALDAPPRQVSRVARLFNERDVLE